MLQPKVIIVGKLPPPFIGPAVATKIILNSELKNNFQLIHLDTTVNKTVEEFGKGKLSKIGKNLKIYNELFKILRQQKPDLILIPISQTTLGFIKDAVFILITSIFKTKILLQLRGSNFRNWIKHSNSITKAIVRFCFARSSGMIVLGNNLKYLFEDYFKPSKIYVIPNGCNLSIPESTSNSNKVQLLYFANFLPSKGLKTVLKSLKILSYDNNLNIELKAVGAWDNEDYKQECLTFVEENKLPVTFYSPKSGKEKWQFYSESDIFIFTPNMPEGHPWVIVEAMAAGLPIISTDQGAIIESVIHNKNGIIVKVNSSHEIAKALKKLVENPTQREAFSKASYNQYITKFTENQMVKNFTRVFKDVLSH